MSYHPFNPKVGDTVWHMNDWWGLHGPSEFVIVEEPPAQVLGLEDWNNRTYVCQPKGQASFLVHFRRQELLPSRLHAMLDRQKKTESQHLKQVIQWKIADELTKSKKATCAQVAFFDEWISLEQTLIANGNCCDPCFAQIAALKIHLRAIDPETTPRGAGVDWVIVIVLTLVAIKLDVCGVVGMRANALIA